MIQCSNCMIWQHPDCTGADMNAETYLCERCDNRKVDLEIPNERLYEREISLLFDIDAR